ncbi:hypothetical protein KY290_034449 [Solanum tuberosum]|uniref:Uncharacterized protein n=1 Tax=Solanum tuberosum TaxID=4113 RepID=A0ABQ7U4Z4_SOLTU|nr:hypothetical protein KY290_034449 [Solanum tuberosum]
MEYGLCGKTYLATFSEEGHLMGKMGAWNIYEDIWEHQVPTDCSWYWRKINGLKRDMRHWFSNGVYILTANGEYSVTKSYNVLIGRRERMQEADLVWNSIMMPRHRFIV